MRIENARGESSKGPTRAVFCLNLVASAGLDYRFRARFSAVISKRSEPMAWIETIPMSEADETLLRAIERAREYYPKEYATPVFSTPNGDSSGIVASHTLIPDALYHAFSTFGALKSPDLPLVRRQHEMIANVVSVTSRCVY
jgi:hypothetical protein